MTYAAEGRADRYLTRSAALVLLALGTLPIANWIPGGLGDPNYGPRWLAWAYGFVICAGFGLVAGILFGRVRLQRPAWMQRATIVANGRPVVTDLVVASLCGVVYAVIARQVFDGKPLLIDEIVQVLQARMYATGHLSVPTASHPEFFSFLHWVDIGPRSYSQFPPGWPALLAIGALAHAEWVVGPVCGAATVFVFARILRAIYAPDATATVLGGALLFGLSPFLAFQFGSHMSHGPVVMWLLLATWAVVGSGRAAEGAAGARLAFAAGACAGCAFAVRPLDAVAFAVPAVGWLAASSARNGRVWRHVAASAMGLMIPVVAVAIVNVRTTGSPLLFGYEALWGASHGLGFHAAPWGDAHTPQRGIELLSLYATRLNTYLFESPFPSLVPVILGLWLTKRLSGVERFLLIATSIHGLLYFAYWHDGFYLGPRFVVPWAPALILMCVRAGRTVFHEARSPRFRATAGGVTLAAVALIATSGLPERTRQYQSGLTSMREDYGAEAARAGVTNALVFVHESWGAELVARLWALGVSRSAAAALYSKVDACVLDRGVQQAEQAHLRDTVAEASLRALLRDSLLVRPSNVSPDTTERMLPGTVYGRECSTHVQDDQDGYALYPPFLLDRTSGNVYARDFGDRDSVLVEQETGRPVFRVTRRGVDGSSPLAWERIAR